MGTSLTGLTPATTYDALIKVTDNGPLSGTAKYLSDGLGNDSVLALSTAGVGVGTATPNTLVELNSATNNAARIRVTGTNTTAGNYKGYEFGSSLGFRGGLLQEQSTEDISIFTPIGGQSFTVTSSGNVGIGTSSPTGTYGKLTVSGGITINPDTLAKLEIGRYSAGASNSYIKLGSTSNSLRITNAADIYDIVVIENNTTGEKLRVLESGGITFNGDTAAANALDDYEEGTFTPSIAGSSVAGTASYFVQTGKYTKIGRQVSCQIDLGYSSGTGSGNFTITGLPFVDASLTNPAVTIGYLDGITLTANNYAVAYIANGTSRIDIVQLPVGGGTLTSVPYDDAGRIILNVTYIA